MFEIFDLKKVDCWKKPKKIAIAFLRSRSLNFKFDQDRDRDRDLNFRDLNFRDRGHALFTVGCLMFNYSFEKVNILLWHIFYPQMSPTVKPVWKGSLRSTTTVLKPVTKAFPDIEGITVLIFWSPCKISGPSLTRWQVNLDPIIDSWMNFSPVDKQIWD